MLVHEKRKIGYALGGGMAWGFFHIGVLKVLEENHIYPDIITGTSMGAIIGVLYASGLSVAEIKQIAIELNWKRMVSLTDISLPLNGFKGKRIISLLKSILKDKTFSQLKIKFACVATDLMTGDQVVLQDGSLIEALRASISLPVVFTPTKINGRYLIDGGLVNVVPVSACRDMGADFIFGVNAIPRFGDNLSIQERCETYYDYQLQHTGNEEESTPSKKSRTMFGSHFQFIENVIKKSILYRLSKGKKQMVKAWDSIVDNEHVTRLSKEPSLSYVLGQTLSLTEYRLAIENLKEADIAITPFNGNIGFWQFNRVQEAINAGEIAARLTLQRNNVARSMLDLQQSIVS